MNFFCFLAALVSVLLFYNPVTRVRLTKASRTSKNTIFHRHIIWHCTRVASWLKQLSLNTENLTEKCIKLNSIIQNSLHLECYSYLIPYSAINTRVYKINSNWLFYLFVILGNDFKMVLWKITSQSRTRFHRHQALLFWHDLLLHVRFVSSLISET